MKQETGKRWKAKREVKKLLKDVRRAIQNNEFLSADSKLGLIKSIARHYKIKLPEEIDELEKKVKDHYKEMLGFLAAMDKLDEGY